ncbi:hypothetical protein [Streptacidiphilus sp. P02-A3a]|uniref:hypothetical protein n=1 Tax=Streptacidiphilus sp. P02-A3a TaxID=2704468 RepID=UPI0015FA9BD2|nr:hypothetical protein [Streptacidiphilus sp. P02-A3a]QMU70630.1 hypothetical protein GXP74_22930 [Streptacidiphilus sp. P02-A3a]
MASKRQPYWRTIGTPTTLVLYRTVDRWRYAIDFTSPSGIADGALNDPAPTCEPGTAQTACRHKAEELTHRLLEVHWRESDQPDWWAGTVTSAGPRPPA